MKHLSTLGFLGLYTMFAAAISLLVARRHPEKLSGLTYKQFRTLCLGLIAASALLVASSLL